MVPESNTKISNQAPGELIDDIASRGDGPAPTQQEAKPVRRRLPTAAIAKGFAIAGAAAVMLQQLTGASWILALAAGVGTALIVASLSLLPPPANG